VKYGKRILFPPPPRSTACAATRSSTRSPNSSGPDPQAALDLLLLEAADGPRDLGVRRTGGLDFTLFRPFNWIGAGARFSIHTPKEGSSRVITQFFGHIVRGEAIKLVDGGSRSAPSPTSTTASTR
jgi:hypothetical protein